MAIRGKLQVFSILEIGNTEVITLVPQRQGVDLKPTGRLELTVTNPDIMGRLHVGQLYDFSIVEVRNDPL